MEQKTNLKNQQPIKNSPLNNESKLVLEKENYYLIIAGIIILIIGFLLMSGGKWTDANVFDESEIYSTRRITIAPIVVVIGFAVEVYAIFHKPRKINNN